jgi:prevent-host-death family protein
MRTVNIHQAKTHLSRLVEAAAAGEEIVIAKAGKPLVKLVALVASAGPRPLGALKGRVRESEDAWAPDPEIEALFYGGSAAEPRKARAAERRPRK